MGVSTFKGINSIKESSVNEIIENNLISYIDWAFLELGAFFNITVPSSGAYGGDRHRLRSVTDPRYSDGQVWEAYRQNWVWESGLRQCSEQPIQISGVNVGSTFYSYGDGHHIDYKHGRVVFDTPIATTSTVQLEYAHKWVSTVGAAEVPWFREQQQRSFRVDDPNFLTGSGAWNDLAETRLQLPLIAVEVKDGHYEGYQLGGGQWSRKQVILHVLAENSQIAKRIANILADQGDSTIFVYDPDRMADENRYPLDYRGEKTSNPLGYPDLILSSGDGGYRFSSRIQHGKLRIFDTHEQNHGQLTSNIYHSTVRWATEVVLPRI